MSSVERAEIDLICDMIDLLLWKIQVGQGMASSLSPEGMKVLTAWVEHRLESEGT